MTSDLQELIHALDTGDPRAQRWAGNQLLAAGPDALRPLLQALATEPAGVRKSVAFLLGALKGLHANDLRAVGDALSRVVVDDAEPKVRKNAAVALGRLGDQASSAALARALEAETIPWVRSSLVLALGAIGGAQARAALEGLEPGDEVEREVLRKALDRSAENRAVVNWRAEGVGRLRLLLDVPVGLEAVVADEATARGVGPMTRAGAGRLRPSVDVVPWQLLPTLRCAYGLLIDAGHGPPLPSDSPELCDAVAALLEQSATLANVRYWLESDQATIRYRFSFAHQMERTTLRATLEAVRAVCTPLGLVDSPSNYDIELIIEEDARGTHLLIRPSFADDDRFVYRQRDVGAAINPVVAACLARLAYTAPNATVFDPVCGSGTLLIERALLDEATQLLGIDISSHAIAATRTNLRAAEVEQRVRLTVGDAREVTDWPVCDEIIANLPFGLRTSRFELDLEPLYADILAHTAERLRPGGRAIFYTTHADLFETALEPQRDRLHVREHLRVLGGGLRVHVWVVELVGSRQ